MRNPPWTTDELILALELYFRAPDARGNSLNKEVINLSILLNSLPVHKHKSKSTFRNANGVGMKLANFQRYDPSYFGKGLERGSKLEEKIWNEYSSDIPRLIAVADSIKANHKVSDSLGLDIDDEDYQASEGKILTKIHRTRERNRKITKKKKDSVLKKTGALKCEVCNFDFHEFYGALGNGFAECHHTKPVSELKPEEKTKLSDLRIVCSNCHRMIHRSKPWLKVEELKGLLFD